MDVEIRTIAPEELETWFRAIETAFGGTMDAEDLERERIVAEPERFLAAIEGGQIVGGAGAYSFEMSVPGGTVPVAGVTGVGVRPTHRRQGVNTSLMRRQLDDLRDREPVAALFASEGGIYGRYGYGLGALMGSIDLETQRSAFVRGYERRGQIRMLERPEAKETFLDLHGRWRGNVPGAVGLDVRWFEALFSGAHFGEKRHWFFVTHEGVEGVDGFAAYLIKHDWELSVPKSELRLETLFATNAGAYADLWRYVLDVDLIHRVTAWNRPADEPVLHLLREPRRLRLQLKDGLWIRLVDLAEALQARRYAAEGRLVLEVRDPFCPWNEGRFELEGGPEGAECRRTDSSPDVALAANDVGAAYLGGASFRQLHRAGRVSEERQGALGRADAMFAWDPAPWCPFMF